MQRMKKEKKEKAQRQKCGIFPWAWFQISLQRRRNIEEEFRQEREGVH